MTLDKCVPYLQTGMRILTELLQGLRETAHKVFSASVNSCSLLSISTLPSSCNYVHKPAQVRDIRKSELTGQAALIN